MPSCPDLDVLARYYEAGVATLPEGASVAAEDLARHIQGCAACRSVIAGLQRTATPSTPPPQGDDAPPPFSPPPRIGRYVIGDVIGAGGMGVVYAAHDPELDRKIALKIVGARDTGDGTAGRVQREARAIAKLSHPNVIAVHDVGTIDGRIFLAMEFAEGGTLREWMARGPRPWREVVAMFVQAGHGLAAAHAAGLVHRDFKPDNVLLDARGRAKVADFGLARAADDVRSDAAPATAPHAPALAATMTKTGAIMGTPAYMAPEQLRAERADARADVFAFSVALYEALYGERPFAGTTLPELVANLEKDRVRDARPGSDVPSWLRALVLQGLRAAPDQRHESMQALVDALEAGGPPVPDDAPVRDEGEPARRSVAARAPRAWIAAAAACSFVALAAIGWWARSGPPTTISPSTSASAAAAARPMLVVSSPRRLTFEDGCEEYPSFMPDGRTIAYDAYADGADRLMLLDVESGARRVLTNDDAWRYQASLSPDGTRLTFSQQKDEDWSTWVMSVDGTGARELAKGEAAAMWTPDGRAIWAGDDPLVRRLDVDTLAPSAEQRTLTGYALTGILELEDGRLVARLYDRASHAVDRIVVFPHPGADPIDVWHGEHEEVLARTRDGAALVISKTMPTKTHELWRVPLDGSPPAPLGAAGVDATKGLAFSRDHRRMVWSTCVTDSVISAIDADGGGFAPVFPKHEWSDFEATAIPGTPRIIALSDRGGSRAPWVLDTSGREPPRMLDVAGRAASDFAVSRDGRWLAFTSAGHGVEVMPLDGSAPPRRVSPDDRDANPSFSRVGTRVYFQMKREGHTHVAAVPLEGGEARVIAEDATLPNASPVDDALAYVTRDGDVRVIEVASGRSRPLSSSIKRGKHTAVRFSEDGRRVAVTNGETEIVEVDARSGTVLRRFANRATPMVSVFYFDRRIGFTSTVWRGDLWIADVEER